MTSISQVFLSYFLVCPSRFVYHPSNLTPASDNKPNLCAGYPSIVEGLFFVLEAIQIPQPQKLYPLNSQIQK
jgi:hypothetical protein